MPSGKPQHKLIRWSAFIAALEFGVTVNKVKKGLAALAIEPGPDGKFTTYEISQALFSLNGLEKKAKEARWRGQIDEAEYNRTKRAEASGKLLPRTEVEEFLTDAMLRLTQIIRHSKLPEQEKKRAINELNTTEFKGGKIKLNGLAT